MSVVSLKRSATATQCLRPAAMNASSARRRSATLWRTAQAAISARLDRPSLARMFDTCTAAVLGEMNSRSASWPLVSPSATSAATSRSRAVSSPSAAADAPCRRRASASARSRARRASGRGRRRSPGAPPPARRRGRRRRAALRRAPCAASRSPAWPGTDRARPAPRQRRRGRGVVALGERQQALDVGADGGDRRMLGAASRRASGAESPARCQA